MPEEIFKLAALAIVFGTGSLVAIAGMVTGLIKHRMRRKGDAGASLTGSELRALIKDAVEDATDPLHVRIGSLERDLAAVKRQLPATDATSRLQLDIPAEDAYEGTDAGTRQRSRA